MKLRLNDVEQARARVLVPLAFALVLPTAWAWAFPAAPLAPAPLCRDGATRVDGVVVCGATHGIPLSPRELLLVGTPIDPNEASAETLAIIPGVGPKLAARIVEDRECRGRFDAVEAIARVKGVGPRLVARMRPYLRP